MTKRNKDIGKGILFANLAMLFVFGMAMTISNLNASFSGILVLSNFVLLPILMGIINSYFWRLHTILGGESFGYGFLNCLIGIAISYFFMGEGYICLIIVSPLIFLFLMLGILFGKIMFRRNKNTLNISVFSSIAVLFTINVLTASPSVDVVTDKVVIHASPEEVWKYVVSFPPIEDKPEYWLFQIGLPNPVESTVEGNYLGASRKCIFSNGIVFDEKIVEYELNKKLTFDIVGQPDDPELLGHLQLVKGQFLLQDNGDGTTTLIGKSWYDLRVKPSLYFDFWTRSILKNVHIRVLDHIKDLSEEV